MMNDLKIWTVYHRDELVEEYGLQETRTRKLYGTHLDDMGRGINRLHPAWSELVALYYIWSNNVSSDYIGINHYRRQFEPTRLPERGECCCYALYHLGDTIISHYAKCHHRQDLEEAINVINYHYCGDDNPYTKYLITSTTLLGNICFVMQWQDFCDMCEWLFPLLNHIKTCLIGSTHYFDEELRLWREKAVRDFGATKADYQMRTISFIGERLISAWIATNLTVIQIHRVNPKL